MSYKRYLTKAEIKALDYIGLHRKTDVIPRRKSCPVSVRIANQLKRKGYVMDMSRKGAVMLTYRGEKVFTQLHPYSKYRIK